MGVCLLLIGLCSLMYLPRLGDRGPWTAGEARAVLTPRLMLQRGEWVAMRMPTAEWQIENERGYPIINEDVRAVELRRRLPAMIEHAPDGDILPHDFELEPQITIHKPVGFYWLIAGLGKLGVPVTLTTARLTSSISAMLTVLTVYLLGAYLFTRRAGLIAALALATSVHFIWISRVAKLDMFITLLMTLAFALFYLALTTRRNMLYSVLMYVVLSAAVLTKGPAYLGIPGLAMILYAVVHWIAFRPRPRFWGYLWRLMCRLYLGPGLLILLALVLPWYLLIHFKTDGQWSEVMFLRHHLSRFYSDFQYGKEFEQTTSWWYYLWTMWPMLFPWIVFLPGALVEVFRKRSRPVLSGALLPLTWFVFMLLFFTVMSFRKDEYLMPAYPAIMLLIGLLLDRYLPAGGLLRGRVDAASDRHLHRAIGGAYLFIGSCLILLALFVAGIRYDWLLKLVLRIDDNRNTQTAMEVLQRFVRAQGWVMVGFAAVAVVAGAGMLWFHLTRRGGLAVAVVVAGSALLIPAGVHMQMRHVDPFRSQRVLVEKVLQLARPPTPGNPRSGDPIVVFGPENHSVAYWIEQANRERPSDAGPWQSFLFRPYYTYDPSDTKLERPTSIGLLDVMLAQFAYWYRVEGRQAYVISNAEWLEQAGYLAEDAPFETVIRPTDLGEAYAEHREPLTVVRFLPPPGAGVPPARLRALAGDRE